MTTPDQEVYSSATATPAALLMQSSHFLSSGFMSNSTFNNSVFQFEKLSKLPPTPPLINMAAACLDRLLGSHTTKTNIIARVVLKTPIVVIPLKQFEILQI